MPEAPTETTAIATKPKPDRRWRRGLRHGLRTRKLPFQGGKAIEQYRSKYRRAIEDQLIADGREIGVTEATLVAAAVLAYEHCMKAGFWLANHHDELDHDQRLAFSREEMKGMAEAAKLLKQLGIDRNPSDRDVWSTLHTLPAFDPDSAPNAEPQPATQSDSKPLSRVPSGSGVQVAKKSGIAPTSPVEAQNG